MIIRSDRLDTLTAACDGISSRDHLTAASQSSRGFTFFVNSESTDDTPTYVLKLAKIGDDDSEVSEIYRTALPSDATAVRKLAVEASVLLQLSATAVPVPAVCNRVTDPGGEFPRYILMEYVDGIVLVELGDLLSTTQKYDIIEQLGRYLAVVHETFSFDRFGELEVINGELRVADGANRWVDLFDIEIAQAIKRLEQTPLADLARPAREWYNDRRGELAHEFNSTAIHEDPNPLNILIENNSTPTISAIVDWEDIMAGPPELQITIATIMLDRQLGDLERPTIRRRLLTGYEAVRDLPTGHEQRVALYTLRQWLQSFSNLQPGLDTTEGRGAAVERHARSVFEELVGTP